LGPVERRIGSRSVILPVDPLSGGTWIGANDAGLAVALINRYPVLKRAALGVSMTRGIIVPNILGAASTPAALERVTALDLTRFDPFQLLLVQGRSVAVVSTDVGGVSVARGWLNTPVMVTSSALGDHLVNGPRMKLFEQLLTTSDSHL